MDIVEEKIKTLRPNIKDSSLYAYTNALSRIHRGMKEETDFKDLNFIYKYDETMEYLSKHKNNTIKNMLIPITIILEGINTNEAKILLARYNDVIDKLRFKINDDITDNVKSEKQSNNWATKNEIYKVVRDLKKEAEVAFNKESPTSKDLDKIQQYILAYLYSGKDIKQLRNDYANMKIIRTGLIIDLDDNMNYLILNKGKPYFLINNYKTSNRYGTMRLSVKTKELKSALMNYIDKLGDEQDYLFLNHQKGNPISENGLTKFIAKTFMRKINKQLTPSLLRAIYISNLDFGKLTYKQKNKIAQEMGHSFDTQQKHYLKLDTEK